MESNDSYYSSQILRFQFEWRGTASSDLALVVVSKHPIGIYDPWERFDKWKREGRPVAAAPYQEFANLVRNDPEALLEYANRCGIPRSPSLAESFREFGAESFAAGMGSASLNRIRVPFALRSPYPLEEFQKEIFRLRWCMQVRAIAGKTDDVKLRNAFDRYLTASNWVTKPPQTAAERRRLAVLYVSETVHLELRGVRLALEPSASAATGFRPAYEYPYLRHALWATFREDIALPMRRCANPTCRTIFAQDRRGKEYCEPYCGVKVARRKYYTRTGK